MRGECAWRVHPVQGSVVCAPHRHERHHLHVFCVEFQTKRRGFHPAYETLGTWQAMYARRVGVINAPCRGGGVLCLPSYETRGSIFHFGKEGEDLLGGTSHQV